MTKLAITAAIAAAALSLSACNLAERVNPEPGAGEAPRARVIQVADTPPATQPQNDAGTARVLYSSEQCVIIEFTTPEGERFVFGQGYRYGCAVVPMPPLEARQ